MLDQDSNTHHGQKTAGGSSLEAACGLFWMFQSRDMRRKDAAWSGLYWVSDSCRDGEIFVRVLILFFPGIAQKIAPAGGWPTGCLQLLYSIELTQIIQQFDIFSFSSFQPPRSTRVSLLDASPPTSASCTTMLPGLQECRALCKICDLWRCLLGTLSVCVCVRARVICRVMV